MLTVDCFVLLQKETGFNRKNKTAIQQKNTYSLWLHLSFSLCLSLQGKLKTTRPRTNADPYCCTQTCGSYIYSESWTQWFTHGDSTSICHTSSTVCHCEIGFFFSSQFSPFRPVFCARPLLCVCVYHAALQAAGSAQVPCSTTLHHIKQSIGSSFRLICIHTG